MNKFAIVLMISLFHVINCGQIFAIGELDTTFNLTGKVFTSFGQPNTFLQDIEIQQDGKIVAVGDVFNGANYDIAVVRYNPDGTLDTSFDGDGKVITTIGRGNDSAKAVAIQPDGKIVVAGSSANNIGFDFAVVRYNVDGSLDTTFDLDGKVTTSVGFFYSSISSIAIQNDGKIVAVGDAFGDEKDFAIVRYQKDGRLDPSFDNDGILLTPIAPKLYDSALSVAIQNDGKIVACGVSSDSSGLNFLTIYNFVVVRYKPNGSLDESFDNDGKLIASFGTDGEFADSVIIQRDHKILVSGKFGQFGGSGILVRYNQNGSLDTTFDNDGIKEFPNELVGNQIVQPDGKILFSRRFGTFPNWVFVTDRINSDGSTDNVFGTNGTAPDASGVSILQIDGKIVVGATANESFSVTRLTGDSPIPATADIVGQIVNSEGRGIANGRITITNLQNNQPKVVSANPFGYFRFVQLPTNSVYQIRVAHKRYDFTESTQTLRLSGDLNGLLIAAN